MLPEEKIAAIQDLYAKGTLTAADVRKVLDAPLLEPVSIPVDLSDDAEARAQKFFAALAIACRAPHFAERQRDWTRELLNRAQEARLYTPESQ